MLINAPHASVMFNAPLKVVAALHRAFINGLKTTDDRKMLPVHLACRVVSNTNVSTYLIYNSVDVLGLKDYKGRTPLKILKQYRKKAADKQDVVFETEILYPCLLKQIDIPLICRKRKLN